MALVTESLGRRTALLDAERPHSAEGLTPERGLDRETTGRGRGQARHPAVSSLRLPGFGGVSVILILNYLLVSFLFLTFSS